MTRSRIAVGLLAVLLALALLHVARNGFPDLSSLNPHGASVPASTTRTPDDLPAAHPRPGWPHRG